MTFLNGGLLFLSGWILQVQNRKIDSWYIHEIYFLGSSFESFLFPRDTSPLYRHVQKCFGSYNFQPPLWIAEKCWRFIKKKHQVLVIFLELFKSSSILKASDPWKAGCITGRRETSVAGGCEVGCFDAHPTGCWGRESQQIRNFKV